MGNAANRVVRLKDFRAGDVGNKVSEAFNAVSGQISDGLQDFGSKARRRARRVARSTDGFVRDNPWQVLGGVALAGLAAGLLVSFAARARRRSDAEGVDAGSDILSGG